MATRIRETTNGVTIRRISREELYKLRPDLRPANDNRPATDDVAA